MTNGDKIRNMTDEELAEKLRCDSCIYQVMKSECELSDCDYGILAWLRKDVDEDAELMTNQDAIEYLLYMKHDVQAKSPIDIALDTAIEALKQPAIEPEVRHWRWVIKRDEFYTLYNMYYAECSECKHTESTGMTERLKYCPACGRKMDGGAENC